MRTIWRHTKLIRAALERGDASAFEFTAGIIPMVMMIVIIAFATVVRASEIPAWSAASACARMGAATLSASIGRTQARRAAIDSLNGNSILAQNAQIIITGDWAPGSTITCSVSYDVDVSDMLGMGDLVGGKIPYAAQVSLRVEPNKSRWQ